MKTKRPFGAIVLIAAAATSLLSCGGGDSGVSCKDGTFYLDGEEFTSCSQCPSDDCGFTFNGTRVCTYTNGVQHCTVTSGTQTARCAGQTATQVISNGQIACAGQTPIGSGSDASVPDAGGPEPPGNIVLRDENNYRTSGSFSIPTVETAPTNLDICWTNAVADLQCHALAPQADVDKVSLVRLSLSEDQVEMALTSGDGPAQSEVDAYFELETDHVSTCVKLSQLGFFGSRLDVARDYVEGAATTYLLMFAKGTTPGLGARTLTFVKPTSTAANTRVDAPAGCGLVNFSADLTAGVPVPVSTSGPWIVDWRGVTRDGRGNAVELPRIDGVLLGFYEGRTIEDLQGRVLDLESLATALWEIDLAGGGTADLSTAKERGSGAAFAGFERGAAGAWLLGLMCNTCQSPAPVVLTVLQPGP